MSFLSIHEKFNKPYLPLYKESKIPKTISSLYMEDTVSSTLEKFVECVKSVMQSYQITLWSIYRAGRITASNFKCTVRTNPNKPYISLVNKICYPQQHAFANSATR